MKLKFALGVAACVAALVASMIAYGGVAAKSQRARAFAATLSAKSQIPKPRLGKRRPSGTFSGELTVRGDREVLEWRLTYRRLTGKPTGAHIHYGTRRQVGKIAFSLCSRCGTGSVAGFTVMSSRKALTALTSGKAYVDVHTKRNRKGEIRGQIRIVR